MAGVTDLAFRTICRELGAAYTITEMVSAKALCYQDKKTLPLMELGPEEHPGGVQIFGSDLACMEEGAAIIWEVAHPDIIDINMGCPVPKVANNGDGSGLLRDLDKACRVAEAVIRGARGTPVTVKMRLGWDKGNIVCLDLAKMLESVGVAAITLHGRTKVQMYSGTANWDYIREVKHALSIPVIANGDVFSGQDAARILRYTGADGVMIARGVFGNPWIFQQAQAALRGEPIPPLPPVPDPAEDPQAQAEAQERRRQLWQAIDALPEIHRTPFLLREMEGYSYREIAKALGLEEGTVKSRLARARVLLRSELLSHGNFWGREASKETKGKGGDLE